MAIKMCHQRQLSYLLGFTAQLGIAVISQPAAALDEAVIDKLVAQAKIGCLVGQSYNLTVDKKDKLIFQKLIGGGEEGFSVHLQSSLGAVQVVDDKLKLISDDKIRDCMKPYIDQIFTAAIGASKNSDVELTDVSFVKINSENGFPVLDVKLRNPGEVVFFKEAIFDVKHVWQIKTGWLPGNQCVTWNYDVVLPILGTPNPTRIKLSQEIKGGETDRFTITLGNDARPSLEKYAFLVEVTLVYNKDNRELKLPRLFFVADSAKNNLARNTGGNFEEAFSHNLKVVDELGSFTGLMNEEAQKLLYEYSSRIVPEYMGYLKSTIPARRAAASFALGRLGAKAREAAEMLRVLAKNDADEKVRSAAAEAVDSIEGQLAVNSNQQDLPPPLSISADQVLDKSKIQCLFKENEFGNEKEVGGHGASKLDDANTLAYRSDDDFKAGRYSDAIANSTKAIELGYDLARFTRGRVYLAIKQYNKAVDDFSFLTAIMQRFDSYAANVSVHA
jgi:tetratricopeptide (TPR) repeat protein